MSQRVWITGASSGLGAALARAYAARGATLALVARRADALQKLATELDAKAAPTPHIYPLDVTDAVALDNAAVDFITRAGLPDVVIANAGISVGTLTEEFGDRAAFERVVAVNLMGMVNTFTPFAAAMRSRGSGRLVGIASVAGVRGLPGAGAYSASKAAVATYLEALRVELRDSGTKVDTPMTRTNPYPMPFMLDADEAARRMMRAVDRGTSYAVVPWQMGLVARLMRILPNGIFDRLAARAGRKPRNLPL